MNEYKTDACFITEIINDLERELYPITGYKFGDMLHSWQKELMEKAGFKNMDELKEYFDREVGEENW